MGKLKQESIPDHLEEDVSLGEQVTDLIIKDFSELVNAKIGVLVKVSEKKTVGSNPSQLKLCTDRDRFYHGLDYIMIIEKNLLRELDPIQFEHLLYRTLSYAYLDDQGRYKVQTEEFKFFKKELGKYGETGMLDIVEIINTVRNKFKKKSVEQEMKDEGMEDFEA